MCLSRNEFPLFTQTKHAFPSGSQQFNSCGGLSNVASVKSEASSCVETEPWWKRQTNGLCLLALLWLTSDTRPLHESRATSQRKECRDRFHGKMKRETCCFYECLAFSNSWLFNLPAVWVAGWMDRHRQTAFSMNLFFCLFSPCCLLKSRCLTLC